MTLKPEFLPAGSIVQLKDGTPVTINWIDLKYLTDMPDKFNDNFKPIELTPEILKDWCGFLNDSSYDKYYIFGKDIAISMADGKIRVIKGNFVCQLVIAEIDFLHELQLLFLGFKTVLPVTIK